MRVVFDTNVLLAAFVAEGLCSKLLVRARKRHFELFLCPFILLEFERILLEKFKAPKQEIATAMDILSAAAYRLVEPDGAVEGVCRDRDDDNVLACVRAATAGYLVTGDMDLLVLKKFGRTRIISPREFEMKFED